jgi:hypothetical protein
MIVGLRRVAGITHQTALEVFSAPLQHGRPFPGGPESVPKKLQKM